MSIPTCRPSGIKDLERRLERFPGRHQPRLRIRYEWRGAVLPLREIASFAAVVITVYASAYRVIFLLHLTTLYVLAIGINAYVDRGWNPPGSYDILKFPPLNLAVSNAKALAAALKQAGAGQYAEVKITEALDADASLAHLQQIIERMASEIHPRDTFVLFAAAHGTSHQGRFYLIPQDYDGGTNPASLQERAIGQDRLQDWVAASRARSSVATRAHAPMCRRQRPPSAACMKRRVGPCSRQRRPVRQPLRATRVMGCLPGRWSMP
jgi:hypothetical protein